MKFYIKIGNKYFKDFESITKGYGGHTVNGNRAEVKKAILTDEKYETSAFGVRDVIGEIVNLMRYGDIPKRNIKIEVEGKDD
jgi:DNA replication protein DnaD